MSNRGFRTTSVGMCDDRGCRLHSIQYSTYVVYIVQRSGRPEGTLFDRHSGSCADPPRTVLSPSRPADREQEPKKAARRPAALLPFRSRRQIAATLSDPSRGVLPAIILVQPCSFWPCTFCLCPSGLSLSPCHPALGASDMRRGDKLCRLVEWVVADDCCCCCRFRSRFSSRMRINGRSGCMGGAIEVYEGRWSMHGELDF